MGSRELIFWVVCIVSFFSSSCSTWVRNKPCLPNTSTSRSDQNQCCMYSSYREIYFLFVPMILLLLFLQLAVGQPSAWQQTNPYVTSKNIYFAGYGNGNWAFIAGSSNVVHTIIYHSWTRSYNRRDCHFWFRSFSNDTTRRSQRLSVRGYCVGKCRMDSNLFDRLIV